jgi:hypothetical protein
MRQDSDWEVCFTALRDVEAHLVRGYLERYGVPCHIRSNPFGLEGGTFGGLGEIQVLVPCDWAKVAHGLIRSRLARPTRGASES